MMTHEIGTHKSLSGLGCGGYPMVEVDERARVRRFRLKHLTNQYPYFSIDVIEIWNAETICAS